MAKFSITYVVEYAGGEKLADPSFARIETDEVPLVPRIGETVSGHDLSFDRPFKGQILPLQVISVSHSKYGVMLELESSSSIMLRAVEKKKRFSWQDGISSIFQIVFFVGGAGMIGSYIGMPVWEASIAIFLIWTAIVWENMSKARNA